MSICGGKPVSNSAAFFAAPLCARDTGQHQRRGMNDPGIAPTMPPRRRPEGRSRPAVSDGFVPRLSATTALRFGARRRRNLPRIVHVDYAVDPMVVLRCTQKLLVRLKQGDDLPPVESTTRLGDWYGNVLRIGHRQYALLVGEQSRLPVVIPIRETRWLAAMFPDAVCEMLANVGVAAGNIAEERIRMSEMAFGRTYFRQAAGLNGAAQTVHDLGANADPRKLARAAIFYENSAARRLGHLLEHFGHTRQAASLRPLARKAKSPKPLDPSVRLVASLARAKAPDAPAWKLSLNVPLEVDA